METRHDISLADYSVAQTPWKREYGNHRARVQVDQDADAVRVRIPWRRRDANPETKAILVAEASNGELLTNVFPVHVYREYGDIVFQPRPGCHEYYVYYLPGQLSGWKYMPNLTYAPPQMRADSRWLQAHALSTQTAQDTWSSLPEASMIDIQAIDAFHRFDPMEVIATGDEVMRLLQTYASRPYLIFPEDRAFPIRMCEGLPFRWIDRGPATEFTGTARPGEFYTFQIGVYASQVAIPGIRVSYEPLRHTTGDTIIPQSEFQCFNLGGTDETGRAFSKVVNVEQGKVQPLWFGVPIPTGAPCGVYESAITIAPSGMEPTRLQVRLEVVGEPLVDAGDSELWRHTRLRWLNSTLAQDDEVTAPYTPIDVSDGQVACLGRTIILAENGLPCSIQSHFSSELTGMTDTPREMLAAPMALTVETDDTVVSWQADGPTFTRQTPGMVEWVAQSTAGTISLSCAARMEYDGYIRYELDLDTSETIDVGDIRLEIPMRKDVARYLMGMGHTGGCRPDRLDWRWSVEDKHQDSVWLGDVNAGMQLKLQAENYVRPLVNIYYARGPLNLPTSWGNDGKGGCRLETHGDCVWLCAYSGERMLHPGQPLHFHFTLLLTPFKPIEPRKHWSQRYYHQYGTIDHALEAGANIVNIHHANEANPYINYPFLHTEQMRGYIRELHEHGLKAKIYYTVRELTSRVVEIWALRSLGDEIFVAGPGGGASWLQEHLASDYVPAWYDPRWQDAAIITQGVSRWNNYMLEGLAWLLKHIEIDGLYIDDMSYGRDVMQRVRKILDRLRPGSLIDFHSWNHFNDRAGFANCANLYLENLPYVDRMWFGEGFNYNESPDYWLIEISGIPFGQMGEMLQDGGNPWRGMLYGMTARMPWSGNPAPIWKLWDTFGIEDAEMIGYWSPNCPVSTDHPQVLATVYRRPCRSLISIASWAEEVVECVLQVDWSFLGLDPDTANITAPAVEGFQDSASFAIDEKIPVKPGRGWLLLLS